MFPLVVSSAHAFKLTNEDNTITKDQKIIRTKVGVLELAKQPGNVSQACKIMGYSRDSFYRFKELHHKGGEQALIEMSRRHVRLGQNSDTVLGDGTATHPPDAVY